jgi:hypothetical protein
LESASQKPKIPYDTLVEDLSRALLSWQKTCSMVLLQGLNVLNVHA